MTAIITTPDWLDEVLSPLKKYSISIAFEMELSKVEIAIVDRLEKERLKSQTAQLKKIIERLKQGLRDNPESGIAVKALICTLDDMLTEVEEKFKEMTGRAA